MAHPCLLFLVDDSADYRFLVRQVVNLFLPHYRVRFFASGAELVEHIELSGAATPKPRGMLLDLNMPGLDGLQTLERVKRHADWQAVPVVVMTNRNGSDFIQESLRLGVDAFLMKPMNIMEIKTILTILCEPNGKPSQRS